MAKKSVASIQTGEGKGFAKAIRMVKSPKTGAYVFESNIIPNGEVKAYFKK